jgi:ubiquitin carboxyl-terminal hydrolase 7
VLVVKNGTVTDAIAAIQKKLNLTPEVVKDIRLYEVHGFKIYKELHPDYAVASISDFVSLYAETTPEEELNVDPEAKYISTFHFSKEPSKPHGVPFKFLLIPVSSSY